MKIIIFWILFSVIVYVLLPTIGSAKYEERAKNFNPLDGLNKHFRYNKEVGKIYWFGIITIYSFVNIAIPLDFYFNISIPSWEKFVFTLVYLNILFSLSCIPLALIMLNLKYSKVSGTYIYEDKIVLKGFLYNATFYRKDIESIQFNGVLWGFLFKLKNGKEKYIMPITENLPQQISTLTNYTMMDYWLSKKQR